MSNSTPAQLRFAASAGFSIRADFAGGGLSSDLGPLLLRGIDRQIGLTARLDAALNDRRHPGYVKHTSRELLTQRLFQIASDVYLKGYATMPVLLIGLTEYFVVYNTERPHQSLGYDTPDQVYRTASGGGARIVDKYSETEKNSLRNRNKKRNRKPRQRHSAACERLPS